MLSPQQKMQLDRFKKELWGRAWWFRGRYTAKSTRTRAQTFLDENQENMIFVMGSGRSGTQLLSDLLDSAGTAKVFHEPNFWEDVGSMDTFRRSPELAVCFWKEFRSLEVYRRWMEKPKSQMYGEVNSTIRYQTHAIKQLFPNAKMILVVRDGRGVIRSVMGWHQFYGPKSKGAYALSPLQGDPYLSEWPKMSRFEKICWSLNNAHEFLMCHIPEKRWLQLEQLTSDFDYFTERFSKYLGIEIPYETWQASVSRKSRNASKTYDLPEWQEWSTEQKKSFERICGETMIKLGYTI